MGIVGTVGNRLPSQPRSRPISSIPGSAERMTFTRLRPGCSTGWRAGSTESESAPRSTRTDCLRECREPSGIEKRRLPWSPRVAAMDITIHQAYLPHDDPDASLAFSRDTLGFEVRNDVGYRGMRWITVGPADQAGTSIVLQATPMATSSGCFRTDECRPPLPRSASSRHRSSAHPGHDRAVSEKPPPRRLPSMRVVPIKTCTGGNLQ
jgi:hypothetical protein